MSGPIFFNKSKSLRTYDRKAQQKRSVSNKTNPVPKTPIVQPSFTQILNENNSMFLEIDLTNLEPDSKKRKSDSAELNQESSSSNTFALPRPVKKHKISNSKVRHVGNEEPDHRMENLSQTFLHAIESDSCVLTQMSNCIDMKVDDNSFSIITNPVTCSQYFRAKPLSDTFNLSIQYDKTEAEPNKIDSDDDRPQHKVQRRTGLDDYNEFDSELILETIEVEKHIKNTYLTSEIKRNSLENVTPKPGQSNEPLAKTEGPNKSSTPTVSEDVLTFKKESKNLTGGSTSRIDNQQRSRPEMLPVSSHTYKELGPFFGLTSRHQQFIMKTKRIKGLYDWQEECLGLLAIHDKTNLIYALPTSGGKTLVAEIAMFREILLRKKNVIFVLPYVSIVQEKYQDLMPFASEFHFKIEEYCAGKGSIPPPRNRKKNSIFICTIEKSQILFDSLHSSGRLKEIGMIVVDELHMVGDASRGYALEMLLMKTVSQKEVRIQVVGMSATIANLREVAQFLDADIYTRDFRPVELKEYVKIGADILSIDGGKKFVSEAFTHARTVGSQYQSHMLKRDPDHVAGLVTEVLPNDSCLIFCPTKQNCESVAVMLAELLSKELLDIMTEERVNLIESLKADCNGRICSILAKTIPFGIAYHHSGLTSDERKHLEDAYRLGILSVICCTSTLAAGVNLPAKRVIIRSPFVGNQFLTLSRYKQMVGRAGRAGKCESGESIMICDPKDHQKLTNLLCSSMDQTVSAFLQDKSEEVLRTVILNLLGNKLATSIDSLVEIFKCSLLNVQIYRIDRTVREVIAPRVKELLEQQALTYTTSTAGNRFPSFEFGNQSQEVFPDDILEVSKLGKAAVNAGLSLEDAQDLERDLVKAHENLVLAQVLHLLYVVVPKDAVNSITLDNKHFNNKFMRLNRSLMHTAHVVGVTESLAMRVVTRPGSIRESEKTLMKRFYVALMLFDLWNEKTVHEVSTQYKVNRGLVFNLLTSAASRAYAVFRFCESYEEFWVFRDILEKFSKRIAYCCSGELLPLMELPTVKIGRAKLLFAAGIKTVEEIASLTATKLVESVGKLNLGQAEHIIRAAKHLMFEKIEECQERLEDMKDVVRPLIKSKRS